MSDRIMAKVGERKELINNPIGNNYFMAKNIGAWRHRQRKL